MSQEEFIDDIASIMLRLAEHETRSSDGSQQPKRSPASWKSTQCTAIKVVATVGWLQAYVKEGKAEDIELKGGSCDKLWKLLDVMLTSYRRDDKLDVRKVCRWALYGEPCDDCLSMSPKLSSTMHVCWNLSIMLGFSFN